MSDGPEWFAPKRYGFGSGLPISLAGLGRHDRLHAVAVPARSLLLHERPYQLIAAIVLPTVLFMVISAKTTRGGWRWRWGEED